MGRTELATRNLDDPEFEMLRRLVYAETGIVLNEHKRSLLAARLARRLRVLGLTTYRDYCNLLRRADPNGSERRELINCVTTNKTEFFRESHHFKFLRAHILEPWKMRAGPSGGTKLRIWSAGCSTGEEPYSIAMTILDVLGPSLDWDVRILASDVDTSVLATAERGVYSKSTLHSVPPALRQRWFEPHDSESVVVRDPLRALIAFRRINFVKEPWPIRAKFDVIFCRNVVIYFDHATQVRLYRKFCELLVPGGYLVAGHSENLNFMAPLLMPVGNTVYRIGSASGHRSGRPPERPRLSVSVKASTGPLSLPPGRVSLSIVPSSPANAPSTHVLDESAEAAGPPGPLRVPLIRIRSGEVHASASPSRVSTVLGSCVAACLFDSSAKVGGMNHFMLPERRDKNRLAAASYGVHAMEMLINRLLGLGAERGRLRAKVYGASHVLDSLPGGKDVARSNAVFVLDFLAKEGIAVVEQVLEKNLPMRVLFETHTGRAMAEVLASATESVQKSESKYFRQISKAAYATTGDNVTLF